MQSIYTISFRKNVNYQNYKLYSFNLKHYFKLEYKHMICGLWYVVGVYHDQPNFNGVNRHQSVAPDLLRCTSSETCQHHCKYESFVK